MLCNKHGMGVAYFKIVMLEIIQCEYWNVYYGLKFTLINIIEIATNTILLPGYSINCYHSRLQCTFLFTQCHIYYPYLLTHLIRVDLGSIAFNRYTRTYTIIHITIRQYCHFNSSRLIWYTEKPIKIYS